MFGTFFYHAQLRRFLIAFGSFFNTIQIRRTDASGAEIQRLTVPLEYGPKERWLVRLREDPEFLQGVSIIVPRMSYEMHTISYDKARKLNSLNSLRFPVTTRGQIARLYVPVPYLLQFTLSILTKTQQDAMQIVEQILPYFTPDLTFKLQTIPEFNVVDEVPMTLSSVAESDNYFGDFLHRRAIVWTMEFNMRVNFYGPAKPQSRIEEVIVDIYNSPLNDILDPPEVIATEDGYETVMEDGSGYLMDERTPDMYLTHGRVARIDAVVTDPDQNPADPIISTTTISETDGDVRRSRTLLTDEEL